MTAKPSEEAAENVTTDLASQQQNDDTVTKEKSKENVQKSKKEIIKEKIRNKIKKVFKAKYFKRFIVVPYLIGIIWTCLHPVVSVITGESKCRGSYIDENALEPGFFIRRGTDYPATVERDQHQSTDDSGAGLYSKSLCESLPNDIPNLSCLRQESAGFDVAKVISLSSGVVPTEETIVLVVPAPTSTWGTSSLHFPLLYFLQRLSNAQQSPWLAKTILLVSPTDSSTELESTISTFLDTYLGTTYHSVEGESISQLPPDYTMGIIRNLLVLKMSSEASGSALNEIRLLPQGRRGVLPNLDYVFAAGSVFRSYNIVMHPYSSEASKWKAFVNKNLSSIYEWAVDLGNMFLFAYTLAMGPYPPHAPVLDRGIDSITIEAFSRGQSEEETAKFAAAMVQRVEYFIRGLSNLHERLHHSITLYLLPSPNKFVGHSEYLIPNILLALPLVIRALLLLFVDIEQFSLEIISKTLIGTASATLSLLMVSAWMEISVMNALFGLVYTLVFAVTLRDLLQINQQKNGNNVQKHLHFLACLLAVYLHVPIIMSHVSLAYPSTLLWTALLAFPSYDSKNETDDGRRRRRSFWFPIQMIILLVTWPPLSLVPNIFPVYTPYVLTVYTPLHILLFLLWLA